MHSTLLETKKKSQDTPGDSMYDHVRPLSYTRADLFVIVFSVVEPASFERVETKVSYNHVPIRVLIHPFFRAVA